MKLYTTLPRFSTVPIYKSSSAPALAPALAPAPLLFSRIDDFPEYQRVVSSEGAEGAGSAGLVYSNIFAREQNVTAREWKFALDVFEEFSSWKQEQRGGLEYLGLTEGFRPAREIHIDIMRQDVIVRRVTPEMSALRRGKRRKIEGLSYQSRKRMMLTARNLPGLSYMLTLTYPADYPTDGKAVKYHFKRFRQFLQRSGFSYGFWFLEFQKRGAPHYHIFLPKIKSLPDFWIKKLSLRWAEIVGSVDFDKHVRAGTRFELLRFSNSAARYASKYATKMEQKAVPADYQNVGRFWGVWGREKNGSRPVLVVKRVSGVIADVVDLLRFVRRAYNAVRRGWRNPRRFRDKGRRGFCAWDTGPALAAAMKWASAPPPVVDSIHERINARARLALCDF